MNKDHDGGSTKYSLYWTDHESNLIGSFRSFYENNSLVDCTIFAEGQCVKVHRMVLSATSSYFQKIFDIECDKHPIIFLKDVRIEIVMSILEFIYTGKVQIEEEQLEEFFNTAQSLQIRGLTNETKIDSPQKGIQDSEKIDFSELHTRNNKKTVKIFTGHMPTSNVETMMNNEDDNAGDQHYGSDNGETSSADPLFITIPPSSEVPSGACGVVSESEQPSSPVASISMEETMPVVKECDESSPKFKPTGGGVAVKSKKIKKSAALKMLVRQIPKVPHKRAPVVITKRPNYHKPPVIKETISDENCQAFVVGSDVLKLPIAPEQVKAKEWLCPPKPSTEEKLYACPQCHKLFGKPSILSNHIRTHTGEQPFKCEICGRTFNQSSNFRRHQRSHWEERVRPKKGFTNKHVITIPTSPQKSK